ncbi:hypothetical protein SLE2022_024890 [Rubroshorea leprosula]
MAMAGSIRSSLPLFNKLLRPDIISTNGSILQRTLLCPQLLKNYVTAPTQKEEMVKVTQGVSQQEKTPKVTPTKICIAIRSFDNPAPEDLMGLPPHTRKIGLPGSRVLYTVLRSPHIDKKSREQFEMRIKKKFLVIKTTRHELSKKFFWLKRQRLFGAQYEVRFSCKTRLDKTKLESLLQNNH